MNDLAEKLEGPMSTVLKGFARSLERSAPDDESITSALDYITEMVDAIRGEDQAA